MRQEFHKIFRNDINTYSNCLKKLEIAIDFIKAGEIDRLKEIYSLDSIENPEERLNAILAFVAYGAEEVVLETYSLDSVRALLSVESGLATVSKALTLCITRDNLKGLQFIIKNSGFQVSSCPILLSLACIRGKFPIIKYLLDNGADSNAKDSLGNYPLEIAVLFNNYIAFSLLEKLRSKQGDELNTSSRSHAIRMSLLLELTDDDIAKSITSPYKYFAKEYADWVKEDPTITHLFKTFRTLRKPKLTQEKASYVKGLNGIKDKYLTNYPLLQNPSQSTLEDEELKRKCVVAAHVKELSKGDEAALLLKRKVFLKQAKDYIYQLLNIYLVTQYTDAKGLIKYANELYNKNGRDPEICYEIVKVYIKIFGDREELKELFFAANKMLQSIKTCDDRIGSHLNLYMHFEDSQSAEEWADYLSSLLLLINNNKSNLRNYKSYIDCVHKELANLYVKIAEQHADSLEKLVHYHSLAFEYDKEDENILLLYSFNLVKLKRFGELNEVYSQAIGNDVIKQLIRIIYQTATDELTFENAELQASALEINDTAKELWFSFAYPKCMDSHNPQRAIYYIYELITLFDNNTISHNKQLKLELDFHLKSLLLCYVHNREPENILNFAFKDKFSDESIWGEDSLVVYFRINAHLQLNQMEEAVELFKSHTHRGTAVLNSIIEHHVIYSIYITNKVSLPDELQSLSFLYAIKELVPDSITKYRVEAYAQHLVLLLPEAARANFSKPTAIQDCFLKDGMVVEPSKDSGEEKSEDSEEEKDWSWEDYDPKKVHEFFQDRKINCIAPPSTPAANQFCWVVDGVEYSEAKGNVYEVDPVFFPKHRAAIDANLQVLSIFLTAIKKGLCSHAFGNNGDKELSNGMFELKANCDSRLLARTLYDDAGEVLILYREVKDHAEIRKICRSQKVLLQNMRN